MREDHGPTAEYVRRLRLELPKRFPGVLFTFLPADIVSQTLNFGLPAPIDIQVIGRNLEANRAFAASLLSRLAAVPGLTDLRVHQAFNQPQLHLAADRTMAAQAGLTQREVASNLLIALSGSGQTTPTYWLNPATGVSYSVATQTPQYQIASLQGLGTIPVTGASGGRPQLIEGLTSLRRGAGMAVVSHYNVQPVIDIFGAVQGRDLGAVSRDITPILDASRASAPARIRSSWCAARSRRCAASFTGLLDGPGVRDHPRLPADRGEFPVVARSVHHRVGPPGRAGGHHLDALRVGNDDQRARADRRHHVRRRGHRQQHPDRELREGRSGPRPRARSTRRSTRASCGSVPC